MTAGRYLWADIETTGLLPSQDLLLEVAVVLTGPAPEFEVLYEDSLLIRHDAAAAYERANAFVQNMHSESGLWQALDEAGALGATEQATDLACWISKVRRELAEHSVGIGHKVPLAGQSPHFDRGFLAVEMPELLEVCTHQHFDLSTIVHLLRDLGKMPKEDRPAELTPHRALTDIHWTIERARAIADLLV